jgi:hypothetical protein
MKFTAPEKTIAVLFLATLSLAPALCGVQNTAQRQELTKLEKVKQSIKNRSKSAFQFIRKYRVAFGVGAAVPAASLIGYIVMRVLRSRSARNKNWQPEGFESIDPRDPRKVFAAILKSGVRPRGDGLPKDTSNSYVQVEEKVNPDGTKDYIDPQTGKRLGSEI